MKVKNNNKVYKKRWSWIIAIAIIIGITSTGCGNKDSKVEKKVMATVEAADKNNAELPKIEEKKETTNSETIVADALKTEVKGELKVHYIDVGQADSILIQQGSSSMLIDAGNNTDSEVVKKYITDQGISDLDFLIGTHPHEDHIGGLDYVINSFKVGKIYMPKVVSTTKTFQDVVVAIKNKGMKVAVPTAGETFKLGEATCTIIAPNGNGYDDINNESIVIKVTFGNNSFLFTGDSEDVSEKEILSKGYDIKSDVLKIAHHGSSSSTTQEFLDMVSPKYSIISVGKDNSYGHPVQSIMDRLKNKNVVVYRTDENGTIVATSNGKDIAFNVKPASYAAAIEKAVDKTTTTTNSPSSNAPKVVTPAPKVIEQETPKQTNNEIMVWLSETGSKYHSVNNCGKMNPNKARQVTLEEAKNSYGPCSKCGPPQ